MMLERYIEAYTTVWRDFALRIQEPTSWLARQQQQAMFPNCHNTSSSTVVQSRLNEQDAEIYASYAETSRLVEAVCEATGVG